MSAIDPVARASIAADEATRRLAAATSVSETDAVEADHLGRSGTLTLLKATLRDVEPDRRKAVGQAINDARARIEQTLEARRDELAAVEARATIEAERLDLTEVMGASPAGHEHLVTQLRHRLEDLFVGMGYRVAEGPEIETDWFNFEALNMPEGHPARSMWDTLYLDVGEPETVLLRTHTSPVQIRTMLAQRPPIYVVAPGRAFRSDTADATHLPVFHQIEGLVIDRGITFADLAGTIDVFVKAIYGDDRTTRLRPSFFPFTEPSAEFDMSTTDGGWIELGGCGMVHPQVLRNGGVDPEEWSGFAFGFGIDRMAMQLNGVSDIRELLLNDMRFLEQF